MKQGVKSGNRMMCLLNNDNTQNSVGVQSGLSVDICFPLQELLCHDGTRP